MAIESLSLCVVICFLHVYLFGSSKILLYSQYICIYLLTFLFHNVQLVPEVSVVSEDGKLYELVVESTVPVPCVEETSSPSQQCSLWLQLSTSSQGENF